MYEERSEREVSHGEALPNLQSSRWCGKKGRDKMRRGDLYIALVSVGCTRRMIDGMMIG